MNTSAQNVGACAPASGCITVSDWRRRFEGVLLGTAVGDALGLPAENLSPTRIRRLWRNEWRMRFIFKRGMISDDTEHTLMVAQALLTHPNDATKFQQTLAWKFRWWLIGVPAGVGLATARACLKLWMAIPPCRSGVASGGSGPAMRSAIIGAFFANRAEKRQEFVWASSRLTHRGWQAETAAIAVAEIVALTATRQQPPPNSEVLSLLRTLSPEEEWQRLTTQIGEALGANDSVAGFVNRLGLNSGVSGYSLHVVSIAIYAWMIHRTDFQSAMVAALNYGGDTDTVGAILGSLCGASGGPENIPLEWLNRIWEWPRSTRLIRELAGTLAEQKHSRQAVGPVRYCWPGIIPRNILFLVVVLVAGLRRLLPPY